MDAVKQIVEFALTKIQAPEIKATQLDSLAEVEIGITTSDFNHLSVAIRKFEGGIKTSVKLPILTMETYSLIAELLLLLEKLEANNE